MRTVLAFDTATEECAVGLGRWPSEGEGGRELLGELNLDTPRAALTHLVPAVTRLLAACEVGIGDVDAVVAGRGPGSFTGVRIGISTAKGLAQGLGVPLWGVGTLDAIAERFAGRDGVVGIVGDAMRGEVYPGLFRCGAGGVTRLGADRVCRPDVAAAEWAASGEGPILLAGNGLRRYADVFVAALGERAELAPEELWTPTGEGLLAAAWRVRVDRDPGDPATALPVYTRLSDAEEAEARRRGLPASGVAGPGPAGGTP